MTDSPDSEAERLIIEAAPFQSERFRGPEAGVIATVTIRYCDVAGLPGPDLPRHPYAGSRKLKEPPAGLRWNEGYVQAGPGFK